MALYTRCEHCGSPVGEGDRSCPRCGAPNPGFREGGAVSAGRTVHRPGTIEELRAFCEARGMPLEKMRFFIGRDYRKPKAFGVYRDGEDFVVYKNKADGSRAIRYRGPDEAFAVGELYDKLMAEHRLRDHLRRSSSDGDRGGAPAGGILRDLYLRLRIPVLFLIVLVLAGELNTRIEHRNDGYYRANGDLFYRYGYEWFVDSAADDWYEVEDFPYTDYREYYAGGRYDAAWGGTAFTDSQVWSEIRSPDSDGGGSYDYGGWDPGDTDWDTDW